MFAAALARITRNIKATVTVLYDGECPICVKEIKCLQYLQQRQQGKVEFIDISQKDYDGMKYGGITYEVAMEQMHVIDEKDKVHCGVPAFKVMYTAVGLAWLAHFISLPGIRSLMDKAYSVFAKNRLKWTGRESCSKGTCAKKQ
ncbi:uncharacterized protein [Lepisosteus oculatus]|uniref:uncharacterized protein isoform X2 n=1 Tax=Lepisosteus oculatus TaxID=7918 RepID=UPI00073FBC84|nr:PREDICTED: uncharacterized protein At5g50100, mitochondrial-like isoform X2 [Lepisosteus oculatus]